MLYNYLVTGGEVLVTSWDVVATLVCYSLLMVVAILTK